MGRDRRPAVLERPIIRKWKPGERNDYGSNSREQTAIRSTGGTPRRRAWRSEAGWTAGRQATGAVCAAPSCVHVLCRAHQDHRLQGYREDQAVRFGPGEDRAAPPDGRLRQTPAGAAGGDTESAAHRADTVRGAPLLPQRPPLIADSRMRKRCGRYIFVENDAWLWPD